MTPTKKPSGLRAEEPKRNLEDFQYLFNHLHDEPTFVHEGGCFALKFPNGNLTFIQVQHQQSYLFAHMRDLARFLNAELVIVKGQWTWEATTTETESVEIEEQ